MQPLGSEGSIRPDVVRAVRQKYPGLHPLVVARTAERAADAAELETILDSVPKSAPIEWDAGRRRWAPVPGPAATEKKD